VISAQTRAAQPSVRSMLASLVRADGTVLVKNRLALILGVAMPLVILVLTDSQKAAQAFGGALALIGVSIAYGLVAASIMGYALAVARDRDQGVFQRLRVTPAPSWTIMASRLGVQVIANLLIASFVLIIGAQMHHIALTAAQYALVLLVSILGGAAFLSIGQAVVALVRSADAVNAVGRLLFLVLAFFGVYGLSGSLGGTVQTVAQWMPVGTVMTLFAGALNVAAWSVRDTQALLVCAGYAVVCAAIGIRWFRWDAR
jgi:ABC-2 type transport system permease protein